jgi:hypothetical protein
MSVGVVTMTCMPARSYQAVEMELAQLEARIGEWQSETLVGELSA